MNAAYINHKSLRPSMLESKVWLAGKTCEGVGQKTGKIVLQ